jgi:hypothetical protein
MRVKTKKIVWDHSIVKFDWDKDRKIVAVMNTKERLPVYCGNESPTSLCDQCSHFLIRESDELVKYNNVVKRLVGIIPFPESRNFLIHRAMTLHRKRNERKERFMWYVKKYSTKRDYDLRCGGHDVPRTPWELL